LARKIKYLLPVLLCTVVNHHASKAQLPETIPLNEVMEMAEKFVLMAEQDPKIFLKGSVNQLNTIRQKEKKLVKQLKTKGIQPSEEMVLDMQGRIYGIEALISSSEILLDRLPAGPYITRFDSLLSVYGFPGIIGEV